MKHKGRIKSALYIYLSASMSVHRFFHKYFIIFFLSDFLIKGKILCELKTHEVLFSKKIFTELISGENGQSAPRVVFYDFLENFYCLIFLELIKMKKQL